MYKQEGCQITVDKKRIKTIEKECDKGIINAKKAIQELERDEVVFLKAYLRGKSVHYGKWINIVWPFVALAIAVLSLGVNVEGADKDAILLGGCIFFVIAAVVVFFHCAEQVRKERRIKVLSYLEAYADQRETKEKIERNQELLLETFEQIEERQRKEREQMLEEWKNRQNYVDKQVALYEASLIEELNNEYEKD